MFNPTRLPVKPRFLAKILERILGLSVLGNIYDGRPSNTSAKEFLRYTLRALGVSNVIQQEQNLEGIPRHGPVLIVANHPLGGLEGIALAQEILKVRPDLRVLTNELLRRIPELSELFIGVDVLSGNAASSNVSGIKQVHKHLKSDGAVLIFPAGMVSAYEYTHGKILDRPWSRLVGQLIKRYECTTVPVWVEGRNSSYFYLAGLIHPRIRTVLLPRQLANKKGRKLYLTFGRPIPPQELRLLSSSKVVTEYLRVSTDALAGPSKQETKKVKNGVQSLASTITSARLSEDVETLREFRLIEHDEFEVYCAPFERLASVIDEIAIAREVTFRDVGEGTGLSKDSDEFDRHYQHLFLWDKVNARVAGAYRVGFVDEIVTKHGVTGLYSRSLYRYDEAFIKRIGAAIEMGRSFIHPDYQRQPVALNLLWRGIGRILVNNPKYHTLFGSVSVSREYSDLARSLIADTLLTNFKASEFAELVKPLTPHKVKNRVWSEEMLSELANIKMLGKLIGRCDPGKAVPVLLRHYLSLNGKMVCFNIHSDFNDSLEGLIIVDARDTYPKTLTRFMGAEGYKTFNEIHKLPRSA